MTRIRRRFAVALSYASEHRTLVAAVAEHLRVRFGEERVFFDGYFSAEIRGTGTDLKLRRIYGEESEVIVPFFCEHYTTQWCQAEWEAIRGVLVERRGDDVVIPVHLDDTRIEGWEHRTGVGIRAKGASPEELADAIASFHVHRYATQSDVHAAPGARESSRHRSSGYRRAYVVAVVGVLMVAALIVASRVLLIADEGPTTNKTVLGDEVHGDKVIGDKVAGNKVIIGPSGASKSRDGGARK